MPEDKFIKACKLRDKLMADDEKAREKQSLSKDPHRSRLERKMNAIGKKIKKDKESFK